MKTLTYGLPAIPIAFLGLPLYIYLPTFYAKDIGLDLALVGAILLITRVLDMISDPFIGRLSDMLARRVIFMIIGAVFMLAGFYELVNPPHDAGVMWLFFFSLLAYFGWSLMNIPYLALNAELSNSYEEVTKLSFSREIFAIVGVLGALALPYIFGVSDDASASLKILFWVVLFLVVVTLGIFTFKIEDLKTLQKPLKIKEAFLKFLSEFFNAKRLFYAFAINNLANAFPATLFLLFVELYLQEASSVGFLLLLYFAFGILALPLWLFLAKKVGKKNSWIFSMVLASTVFVFVPFLQSGDLILFSIICVLSGLSLGADMALPAAMQSDIVQVSQNRGNQLGGVLFGMWAFLTKFAFALAVGIAFGILGLIEFDMQSPSQSGLVTLSILYAWVPVSLKIIAVVLLIPFKESKIIK